MNGLNHNYLSQRNQITVIDGITSSSSSISHGVPQGALLFLIFINDLPNSSSLFKFIFADENTLSTSFAEENALEFTLTLNHELNNVNNWLTSNCICINGDNTKYMIFSYRKLLHLTNIKIGSATIEETNSIKFLGIILDKHLIFKHHVDVLARKISKSVGILFKLSKYLPLEIIKTLYYSLINPVLLYEIEVWHGTC